MRLDGVVPETEAGRSEAEAVRGALNTALSELRAISRGLSLPDLDRLGVREVVERALETHARHTQQRVTLACSGLDQGDVPESVRICLYRFLQEALSNASRYAGDGAVSVEVRADAGALTADVRDTGPGFDPEASTAPGSEGGDGLAGLRDRAESLGGDLAVRSCPGEGTVLTLTLPLDRGDVS
jgi:signal transduction histidine kinase